MSSFVVGNFCYGGNQALAEIFREPLTLKGIQLKLCHEYPNADVAYDNHEGIYEFIDSCDIIILPARYLLQPLKSVNRLALAWSRKKAVVIPPLPSYLKYAEDGVNCLIANTQEEFLAAIEKLKDDQELRDRLASAGHSTAVRTLDPRSQIDKFLLDLRKVGYGDPWPPDTFVQFIIPHYANRLDYLELAVKSAVATRGPSRDILVVSSSKADPRQVLAKYEGVRVHYQRERLTFSQANNIGLKIANPKTTHFFLLNDDTIMGKNALANYFEVLKDNNFILNPYSNCDKSWLHNDTLEVNGIDLHPNMKIEDFAKEDLEAIREYEPSKDLNALESNFCAFYATLIPKAITDRVGLLSGKFVNGGEDLDYCLRAKNLLGASSYWTKNAFVFHFGGKTRKFSEDENYEKHHAEDRYNHSMVAKRWPQGKKRVGIWAGPGHEYWDLLSYRKGGGGLGGSETCAGRLSELCAKEGHYITLYGEFYEQSEQFGVELIPWRQFVPEEEYFDTFIALRNLAPIDERLKAKKKLVWIHDLFILSGQQVSDYHRTVVDKFIVLTPFHLNFASGYHSLPREKFEIIPNGVNVEIFGDKTWEETIAQKEYGNMIFVSSPDRGLENIIYCLGFAREQIPELKLQVFYGTHNWLSMAKARNDLAQIDRINNLMELIEQNKDWIIYRDRVNQHELAKEWLQCYAWAYSDTFQETYCLSAKEAQCSATPIVSSNVGALETTVGEFGKRIMHHPYSREGRVELVEEVIKLHKDKDYWVSRSKQSFEGSKGISWNDRYEDYWRKWIEG